MGLGPTGSDIAQTLAAVGDRLSNILIENRRFKARQQELEAAAKTKEREFRLKEREFNLKLMEQQVGAAGGQDGEPSPGKPLDVIRAANAERFIVEDFEREFVNQHGGINWVDMDSKELKRSLGSIQAQIDNLQQEKLKITNIARGGEFDARIAELQRRFEEGRTLLTRMAKAREEDETLRSRLSAVRGLLTPQARRAFEAGAQPQRAAPAATPSAPTVPVDRAQDTPQSVEVDGPALDVRDATLQKFRDGAKPVEIKQGLRELFRGLPSDQINAISKEMIQDVLTKEGPDKARELFNIIKTYKKD